MRDPTRGGGYTIDAANSRTSGQVYKDGDNVWGNYTVSDKATVAADAQYGAMVTWDYFKNVHDRSGIANDGKAPYSRVHYGRRYSNAFWSDACFCMTYGDGDGVNIGPLVALDIVGHELSHGVNARTANLIYSGESGGLNEANSDILGTMIDFYANNPPGHSGLPGRRGDLRGQRAGQPHPECAALHVQSGRRRPLAQLLLQRHRNPGRALLLGLGQPVLLPAGRRHRRPGPTAASTIRRRPATGRSSRVSGAPRPRRSGTAR